ncbi:MAG: hypothetical protein KDC35_10730 [Acidobacteria bacterium]|nr:hypothetical protein [Acidobacteriota bacterium]
MKFIRNLKAMMSRSSEDETDQIIAPSETFVVAAEGVVLNGDGCSSLHAKIFEFQCADGSVGAAATDVGMGKVPNEDAVVIVPRSSFVSVIDGVGGYWGGQHAASFFGEGMRRFPDDCDQAIHYAQSQLKAMKFEESLKLYGSSACFISARIFVEEGKRWLRIAQTGDCRLMVFRANGDLIESEDESYVNDLVSKELISPDQSTYHELRNRITNSLRLAFKNNVSLNPKLILNGVRRSLDTPLELFPGDRICMVSDGIADNLTAREVRDLIREKTPKESIEVISEVTGRRMAFGSRIIDDLVRSFLMNQENIAEDKTLDAAMLKIRDHSSQYHWLYNAIFHRARHSLGRFPDGFVSKPSQDNRAMAVFDIPS